MMGKVLKTVIYFMILFIVSANIANAQSENEKTFISIKKYPFGFTCFKIIWKSRVTIVTDPYAMDEDIYPDIVTESHQHNDHSDLSRIKGNYKLITDTGIFEEKSIKITGISGAHDNTMFPADDNKNNIYIFDFDGIRLAEFGSQGKIPDEKMFEKIGKVDILIIQYFRDNGYKLRGKEMQEIIKKTAPKVIIPAHGDSSFSYELADMIGGQSINIENGRINFTKKQINEIDKITFYIMDN